MADSVCLSRAQGGLGRGLVGLVRLSALHETQVSEWYAQWGLSGLEMRGRYLDMICSCGRVHSLKLIILVV